MKGGWILGIGLVTVTTLACGGGPTSPTSTKTESNTMGTIKITTGGGAAVVHVGETVQYTATIEVTGNVARPAGPVWSSSNSAVITIDANGNATGRGVGDAVIQALIGDPTKDFQTVQIPAHVVQ
jgi:hypothetical protein